MMAIKAALAALSAMCLAGSVASFVPGAVPRRDGGLSVTRLVAARPDRRWISLRGHSTGQQS